MRVMGLYNPKFKKSFDISSEGLLTLGNIWQLKGSFLDSISSRWGHPGCCITSSTTLEVMIVSQSAVVISKFNQPVSGHMIWA